MKITDALLAEHVVFHSIFSSIQQELPNFERIEECQAVAKMLLGTLEAHGQAEHDLLLPPLEPFLNEIGHLEHFHQEDEAIVANLRATATDNDLESAKKHLHKALRLASDHFEKEERLVFPMAENHISEESLHELGAKWSAMKEL